MSAFYKPFVSVRSGAGILVIAMLTIAACTPPSEPATTPPVAVRTQMPARGVMSQSRSYLGTIHSRHEVRILARIQGTVAGFAAAEGDHIDSGDLLVRLSAPEVIAARERATADWQYWHDRHSTDQRLVTAGAVPTETAAASGRAARSARAVLDEVEARVDFLQERAPISGTLLAQIAEPGQHVMPGQLLAIVGGARREVRIQVVEQDAHDLQVGGLARLIDGDSTWTSTIAEIAPSAQSDRTYTVRIGLPANASSILQRRWGASAAVALVQSQCGPCLSVPTEAIAYGEGQPRIFLIRDGVARMHPVTPGIVEAGRVQIDVDWNGTDAVAVSNHDNLRDGTPVFAVPLSENPR